MSVTGDVTAAERRIDAICGPRAAPLQGGSPEGFGRTLLGAEALVRRAAVAAGVDPSLAAAVARTESNFDPAARSPAGAAGLMQLMPATAQALGIADPYDPAQNARGGARYLRELLDRFGGDVRRAVAAYNSGPGAVERFGGVPPFAETRRYVERVLAAYRDQRRE